MPLGLLLVALIPGIVILLVTWWFKRMGLSLFIRLIPGILTVIAAVVILFYIDSANIIGFEGLVYAAWSFLLIAFSVVSFVIASIKPSARG